LSMNRFVPDLTKRLTTRFNAIKLAITTFRTALARKLDFIIKPIQGIAKSIGNKIGGAINAIKGIGKRGLERVGVRAGAKLGGRELAKHFLRATPMGGAAWLAGKAVEKIGIGRVMKVTRAAGAAPIVGGIAELAYGSYKTYDDLKKGRGWGAAGTRFGATVGLSLASLFDPTGFTTAGASITAHYAMDKAFEKWVDKPIIIENHSGDGIKDVTMQTIVQSKSDEAIRLRNDLNNPFPSSHILQSDY